MIYAIDFDGTLCENEFPEIGKPKLDVLKYILNLKKQGHKIILWTCRNKNYLEQAVLWCKGFGIEFDAINDNLPEFAEQYKGTTRKVYADYYIDDKNLFLEDVN